MIEVVAGIITQQGKLFIARRAAGKHMAGFWEFPGGKLEPGESPEQCLARELKEELDMDVLVKEHFMDTAHAYGEKSILLKAYFVQTDQTNVRLKDHDEAKWVQLAELREYVFAPADIPIVEALLKELKEL